MLWKNMRKKYWFWSFLSDYLVLFTPFWLFDSSVPGKVIKQADETQSSLVGNYDNEWRAQPILYTFVPLFTQWWHWIPNIWWRTLKHRTVKLCFQTCSPTLYQRTEYDLPWKDPWASLTLRDLLRSESCVNLSLAIIRCHSDIFSWSGEAGISLSLITCHSIFWMAKWVLMICFMESKQTYQRMPLQQMINHSSPSHLHRIIIIIILA